MHIQCNQAHFFITGLMLDQDTEPPENQLLWIIICPLTESFSSFLGHVLSSLSIFTSTVILRDMLQIWNVLHFLSYDFLHVMWRHYSIFCVTCSLWSWVKSSWALLSFCYMCGRTVKWNVVPHRTTVLHEYRHTTMKSNSINLSTTDLLSDLTIHMLYIKVVTYT